VTELELEHQAPGQVRWSDRVLVVGMNGNGKSELAAHLFNQVRCRRVLVDPKGDWQVAGAPRYRLRAQTESNAQAELEGVDWAAPIVHVQPDALNRPQLEALYAQLDRLAPCLVWTDEAYMATTGSWEPRGLRSIQTTGRSRGIGHLACTQRPKNISVTLRTEAQHIFVFRDVGSEDLASLLEHLPYVANLFDLSMTKVLAELPEYGFVWFDRGARDVRICDPLPAELLGAGIVTKAPGR